MLRSEVLWKWILMRNTKQAQVMMTLLLEGTATFLKTNTVKTVFI